MIRIVLLVFATFCLLSPTAAASSLSSSSQQSSIHQGAKAFATGDYLRAFNLFTEAIPTSPELGYANRCRVQLHLQRYQAAADDCAQAIEHNPNQVEARLNLGLAYYSLEQYSAAASQYQQVLQISPHDYRASYNLGLAQASTGEHRLAIVQYSHALETMPPVSHTKAAVYRDRGVSYMLLENYSEAVRDLTTAIEQDPGDVLAHFDRGCAYHRSRQLTLALQEFGWVVEQAPQNAQAYFNQGSVLAQMGKTARAIATLNQALQNAHPADPLTARARHLIQRLERHRPVAISLAY